MKSTRILNTTLALVTLLASSSSFAAGGIGMRTLGSLGLWNGSFTQKDGYGHETNIRTLTSLGLQFGLGATIGIVFIEYNFSWFFPNYVFSLSADENDTSNATIRDAVYFAPLGLNAGVTLPMVPIEPYVGIEKATFGFSSGSRTDFSGVAGKLGVNFQFLPGLGARLEYRRHFISEDDAGDLPSGVETGFSTWYLGIVGGKF